VGGGARGLGTATALGVSGDSSALRKLLLIDCLGGVYDDGAFVTSFRVARRSNADTASSVAFTMCCPGIACFGLLFK
jgi:hypothetical protein